MTIGSSLLVKRAATEDSTKPCAVLLINPNGSDSPLSGMLVALGFHVDEARDWPAGDGAILAYHVVVVTLQEIASAPMIAARLRAKPRFGRRVLIAQVPSSARLADRQAARASGFDDVVTDRCEARELIARILRCLRSRPEFDCVLPSRDKRRSAA